MKQQWITARATAAKNLGMADEKNQAVHQLMVVRETKRLHEEHDGDWTKVFAGLRAVGHGFGMNASQFNQWLDKQETAGKTVDLGDLTV